MDDADAVIAMIDSNLQREHIKPSEKAYAYKMKLEAMKSQGKRNDLTSSQLGTKLEKEEIAEGKYFLRSDERLAKEVGESRNQIARYIRLAAYFAISEGKKCSGTMIRKQQIVLISIKQPVSLK